MVVVLSSDWHCFAHKNAEKQANGRRVRKGSGKRIIGVIGRSFAVIAGWMLVAGIFAGCTRGVHGGNPAVSLSNSNGTAGLFTASESTVLVAISNAFTTGNASNPAGYRGMMLCPAAEQSYLVPNWHPTNGFVLFPLMGPIVGQGSNRTFALLILGAFRLFKLCLNPVLGKPSAD